MPHLATIPVDENVPAPVAEVDTTPALDNEAFAAARLSWPRVAVDADAADAGSPACIAVWLKIPGGAYESQTERILPVDATEFVHTPVGFAGEYCYQFAVLAGDSRSEFTETCFQLEQDQLPPGPDDSGGTPLPPTVGQGIEPASDHIRNGTLIASVGLLVLAVGIPVAASQRRRKR
jgi:hypothetical protein